MGRRLLPLAAAVAGLALGLAAASATAATTTPLAPVGADTPLSAYGGYVVWSERGADGRYRLVAFRDGATTTLSAAPRSVPFDADVGPDVAGRPTVTYSRCATEATAPAWLQPWSTARGCAIRALTLPGGGERPVPIPRPAGASDSTPSVWRGQLAFQRRVRGVSVSRLLLYDVTTHRLRTLRHGAVPHACHVAGGCAGARFSGEVGEIDLGPRTVAFSWHLSVPAATGAGPVWELRAERLSDRRSLLAGNGYVSGACGARTPHSPNATAEGVTFLSRWYHCEQVEGTVTATTFPAGGLLARGELPGTVLWRIARDGATGALYGLSGPATQDTQLDGPPAGSLELVHVGGLTLQPTGRRAGEPFIT